MTMNNRLFLDVYAIQTVPPSNINRDDTGSPKTAQFGGVRRARVSSQSWKRAIRKYFLDNSAEKNVGIRTLEIVRYLADKIRERDSSKSEEEAMQLAEETFAAAKISTKDHKAKALFFLGETQADRLVEAALAGNKDKKEIQSILKENPSIDIALFGRMVADDPSLNEDASCQVAHSISTHEVKTEFDFYTAVDDLAPEDNAGAGMIGTIEYNSSTLYRYANVAVHELEKQMKGQGKLEESLQLFIEAFVKSMPTGKVNTFGNQTLPQALLVVLRQDRPVNLVSAFEQPVTSKKGYVNPSIQRLFEEEKKVEKFVEKPLQAFFVGPDEFHLEEKDGVEVEESLPDLLRSFSEALEKFPVEE